MSGSQRKSNKDWRNEKIVIVPDTCALVTAAVPIPEDFFICEPHKPGYVVPSKRPKTFLDLYNALPAEKVRAIHVLDIVLSEFLGVTPEGLATNGVHPHQPDYEARTGFMHARNSPWITIPNTPEGEPYVEFCRLHHDFMQSARQRIAEEPNASIKEKLEKQFEAIERPVKKLRLSICADKGEQTIGHYISRLNSPVLFITDDQRGVNQVKAIAAMREIDNPIRCMSTLDLMRDLKEKGILQAQGIKSTITPETMVSRMIATRNPKDNRVKHPEKIESFDMAILGKNDLRKFNVTF